MKKQPMKKHSGVSASPSQADINNLIQAFTQGQWVQAETLAKSMLARYPRFPFGWKALGAIFIKMGRIEDALIPMQKSIDLFPNDPEAHNNLGTALKELGRPAEAERHFRRSLAFKPDYVEAHSNLANALKDMGQYAEAEKSYRKAIALQPDYAGAYNNLGVMLQELNRLTEAEEIYKKALALNDNLAETHSNLGLTLQNLGRLEEAVSSFRRAITLKPDFALAHSNLLFALNYMGHTSPMANLEEAKRIGDATAKMSIPRYTEWRVSKEAQKLKIGFVSGDFKNHPVAFFLEGLLSNIDKTQFELIAYSTRAAEDDFTPKIQSLFDQWHPLFGKSDAEAARRIHEDGTRILFDLSGHTSHNRLAIFAYKPAPVQVSWLGYPATTGLPQMDYILGDPYVTPANDDHHFTERVWRLPETYICMTPPQIDVEIQPLPALSNGYVTFGCFNNLIKINTAVISLWSRILHAIDSSRLFLRTKQLGDTNVAHQIKNKFASFGIAAERLILEGHSSRFDYFNAFNRVDIALDPFPYPGFTITVEGLWMGVPFISLRGDRFVSHSGEGIAFNTGLDEWIAAGEEDYLKKAVSFSADWSRLSVVRNGLRKQVLLSPLFDTKRFSRHFEEAVMKMSRNS